MRYCDESELFEAFKFLSNLHLPASSRLGPCVNSGSPRCNVNAIHRVSAPSLSWVRQSQKKQAKDTGLCSFL